MTRKFLRLGKLVTIVASLFLLNTVLFLQYGSISSYNELIPKCIHNGNTEDCEYELLLALPKIVEKIIALKSLLTRKDYNELWDIHVAVSKIISRENAWRKTKNAPKILQYSCAETYNGTTFGYPYFKKGYTRTVCRKPPLSQSTSIIIDRPIGETDALHAILEYAFRTFHQVFLIIHVRFKKMVDDVISKLPDNKIQAMFTGVGNNLGKILNKALYQTTAPFVLVAPHLGKLDNNSDIERLINVYEMTGAKVVGSAVKSVENGEWDRGCYQSEMHAYTLKYFPGYTISENECLYCTHLVSPFLAKTETLRHFSFAEFEAGVYRDLFLRFNDPKGIVSCPDVLFYIKPQNEIDDQLVKFSSRWDVTKIIEADGNIRWFGVRAGFTYTSNSPCQLQSSLLVPPDCRANLLDAILFIFHLCNEHNLQCELQEGTLLGAVKFNHVLPWERDADITVLSADFKALSELKDLFDEKGYGMYVYSAAACCFEGVTTGGVMKITAHGWIIEVYGQHKLTSSKTFRTKVLMGDKWVYTPENPGLYVRNRYGREVYKHAEHWLETGKETGWDFYDSGFFRKCEVKGHHGCLDQYKADGDLQFRAMEIYNPELGYH